MEDLSRIYYLWQRYADGLSSEEDLVSLRTLLEDAENEKVSREWLIAQLQQTAAGLGFSEKRLQAVLNTIRETAEPVKPARRMHLATTYWWAAAAILLCLLIPGYLILSDKPQKAIAKTQNGQTLQNDLVPGGNKAVLTLANGTKIVLDSARNGVLARQASVSIVKLDNGKLAYNQLDARPPVLEFNTLSTPKGGQYQLNLPDGSKVWLNAASSIRYPTAFTGAKREVEITGEVYFEIAKDAAMPFVVRKINDEAEIRVLGTHFDVNAYDDEPSMKITLLEGSVQITKAGRLNVLLPGQQEQIQDGKVKLFSDVDTEEVVAWKNGKFQFGDASDINSIMRQIARWYDVDVEYRGMVSGHIGGTISRQVNASRVFSMLEMTGAVHFSIEGKKVTVMP